MDSTAAPAAANGPSARAQPHQQPSAATPDLGDVPLVFQCKGCRSLVGDTTAWWCALKDNRPGFALFAQHRNVQVGTLTVAQECTYRDLACLTCAEMLGQYIEVPPKDDPTLSRKYVYHLDCVIISGLGGYVAEPEHEFNRTALQTVPAPAATSEELHMMTYGIKELNKKVDYIIAKYVSKSHARHKQRVEAAVLAASGLNTTDARVPGAATSMAPPPTTAHVPQTQHRQQQQQQPQMQQQQPQSQTERHQTQGQQPQPQQQKLAQTTGPSTSRKSSVASTTSSNAFVANATPSNLPPGSTLTESELNQYRAHQASRAGNGPSSAAASGAMAPPPPVTSAAHHLMHQAPITTASAFAAAPAPPGSTPPSSSTAAAAAAAATLAAATSHPPYASLYRPAHTGPLGAGPLNYVPMPLPGNAQYAYPGMPSSTAGSAAVAAAAAMGVPGLTPQQAEAFFANAAMVRQQMGLGSLHVMPPAGTPGASVSTSAGVGNSASGPAAKRQKTGAASAAVTAKANSAASDPVHKVPPARSAAAGAAATTAAQTSAVPMAVHPPAAGPPAPARSATPPGKKVELVTIDDDDD